MVDLSSRPVPTAFSERVGLICVRYMEAINVGLFRLSHGAVGGSIFGAPVILLTTSGRVTGNRHTKPLLALPDGPAWIVVGSRGGTTRNPDWYENLLAYETRAAAGSLADDPALAAPEVELGDRRVAVRSEVLAGTERDMWWASLVEIYARFDAYQARAPQREIPVVRLTPTH